MPCDPLTKTMSDEYLQDILDTNIWDFRQPEDSKMEKQRKQAQRRISKKTDGALGSDPRSASQDAMGTAAGSSSFRTPSRTPWEGDFDDEGST